MIIKLKRTFSLNSIKQKLSFTLLFLFLLPNDYKHLVPGFGFCLNLFVLLFDFIFLLFNYKKTMSFFLKNIIFLVPFVISVFSSIIYFNDVLGSFYSLLQIITIMIIMICFFESDLNYLKLLEKIIFIILIITCFSIYFLKHPMSYSESGGRIYFIFEGEISKTLLSSLLLTSIIDKKQKLYLFFHFVLYLMLYLFILQSGITSSIGITLFFFCILLSKFKELNFLLDYKFILIIFILLYLIIINGFGIDVLSDLFNKSTTLSGRTDIWKSMFNIVKQNPLIGVGELSSKQFISITNIQGATHAHNQILQILLNSGIVGLFAYILIFTRLTKIKKLIKYNKFYRYFVIYLFCVLIMSITRNCFDNLFHFFMLLLICEIEKYKIRNTHERKALYFDFMRG